MNRNDKLGRIDKLNMNDKIDKLGRLRTSMKKINIWYGIYAVLFAGMLVISRHVFHLPAELTTLDSAFVTDFHLLDIPIFALLTVLIYAFIRVISAFLTYAAERFLGQARKTKWWMIPTWIAFFLVLWIPYLMSYWPGGVYSDTVDSINMALNKAVLDNHNPILYTLIWKAMFGITGAFSGAGDYPGLKLFTVVQMVLIAFAMAFFLYRCYQRGVHKLFILAMTLIVGIVPLYPLYGISLWKDTLFSLAIFAFSLFLYGVFRQGRNDISGRELAVYCVLCCLVVFLRNNGIYVVFLCAGVIVLICFRKRRKLAAKMGVASLIIILASAIVQGPVYDTCGYNIDKSRESLGIPIQQVAYIVATDGVVAAEDREVLEAIMPMENWRALYNPIVVDSIKFDTSFNREYFEQHAGNFFQTYVHLVLQNPVKAGKAYLLETMGFWDISKNSATAYICNFSFSNSGYCMSDYFDYYLGFSFKEYVEPRSYISSAIFAWILLFALMLCLAKRRYFNLICLLPGLGLWLSIMVATPVAFSFRYVFALFLCLPLYLIVALETNTNEREDVSENESIECK